MGDSSVINYVDETSVSYILLTVSTYEHTSRNKNGMQAHTGLYIYSLILADAVLVLRRRHVRTTHEYIIIGHKVKWVICIDLCCTLIYRRTHSDMYCMVRIGGPFIHIAMGNCSWRYVHYRLINGNLECVRLMHSASSVAVAKRDRSSMYWNTSIWGTRSQCITQYIRYKVILRVNYLSYTNCTNAGEIFRTNWNSMTRICLI